jgi:ABC-type maltose transport system permease subunit
VPLHINDLGFFWLGAVFVLSVVYQSFTGKSFGRRKMFQRKDNPIVFWLFVTMHGLVAIYLLSASLGFSWLSKVAFLLFALLYVSLMAWGGAWLVRRSLKSH